MGYAHYVHTYYTLVLRDVLTKVAEFPKRPFSPDASAILAVYLEKNPDGWHALFTSILANAHAFHRRIGAIINPKHWDWITMRAAGCNRPTIYINEYYNGHRNLCIEWNPTRDGHGKGHYLSFTNTAIGRQQPPNRILWIQNAHELSCSTSDPRAFAEEHPLEGLLAQFAQHVITDMEALLNTYVDVCFVNRIVSDQGIHGPHHGGLLIERFNDDIEAEKNTVQADELRKQLEEWVPQHLTVKYGLKLNDILGACERAHGDVSIAHKELKTQATSPFYKSDLDRIIKRLLNLGVVVTTQSTSGS